MEMNVMNAFKEFILAKIQNIVALFKKDDTLPAEEPYLYQKTEKVAPEPTKAKPKSKPKARTKAKASKK
tara:strand:+ start:474 stop:680 length:207 start_codon:yes stop_codon:yes gene_type:complete